MERRIALRRLRNMLGKNFAYQHEPNAPSPEQREQARERHTELCAERDRIRNASEERRKQLLDNDPEYVRLQAEWQEIRKQIEANNVPLLTYKFTVGTANKLFFHVEAQGDTWEEIFRKLEGKKK